MSAGYVYLVAPVGHNAYKIGASVSLHTRMQRMQRKRICKLEYVAVIFSENYFALEAQLIAKYQPYKLDGDWFALPVEEVEYIKGLAT